MDLYWTLNQATTKEPLPPPEIVYWMAKGYLDATCFLCRRISWEKGVEEYEGKSSGLNSRKEAQDTKTINLGHIYDSCKQ